MMLIGIYILDLSSIVNPSMVHGISSSAVLYFFYIVIITGLMTALVSFALALWLDQPLRKFMESAIEIGRGNFTYRIPPQGNPSMNKIARLVNFMAEEMDHLQRINVHGIIHEKNKTEIILRNVGDGVIVLDQEGRISLLNETVENWFAIREKAVLHKPFENCIKNKALISLLQRVLRDQPIASTEFILKNTDNRQNRIFSANATRVNSSEGRPIGTIMVLREVTKEKEADRIKTELVSMVAHELKSPLTSIYGFSELLLEIESKNKKAMEYAKVIQVEASRLTDFVNKFLNLSRLESGKIKIKLDPFDLKQLLEKCVNLLRTQAEAKHVLMVMQIPDSLPLVVGDPELIEQVLVNLIGNAIKYSPSQSKVGLEVNQNAKEVNINVIDNGYGIPKEDLQKIFDKFYRVFESQKDEQSEGSGLGLALVKEIIEKHEGTIKVKSKLGVGSIFSFSLFKAEMISKEAIIS